MDNTLYLLAKQTWNDRYYAEAQVRRNWQLVSAVFAVLALLAAGGFLYVVMQQKLSVIVAQIDQQGHFLGAYEVKEETITVPQAVVIGHDLADFITYVRGVGADYWQKRAEYDRVKAHLAGAAEKVVNEWFEQHPPHEIMKTATIMVSIQAVIPEAGKTWRVRWTEERRDKVSGVSQGKTWWEATLTVELQAPKKETVLLNPFGVYVTSLSWGETKEIQG